MSQRRKRESGRPDDHTLDLLVLGNAIVDVIARTDDAFLDAQGVTKARCS